MIGYDVTHIAVDIVGINSITSLLSSKLDTLLHDIANIGALEVNPLLIRPSIHGLAKVSLLELVLVIAPVLPRPSAEVTDDLLPGLVQRLKSLGIVVVQVQIVDTDIGLEVLGTSVLVELYRLEENDLPLSADLWLPETATGFEVRFCRVVALCVGGVVAIVSSLSSSEANAKSNGQSNDHSKGYTDGSKLLPHRPRWFRL